MLEPGWARELGAIHARILTNALAGLYNLCGVNLVREQVDGCFGALKVHWIATSHSLVVWPADGEESRAVYPLRHSGVVRPQVEGKTSHPYPEIDTSRLLFSDSPISWAGWVDAWMRDQAGEEPPQLVDTKLLPD